MVTPLRSFLPTRILDADDGSLLATLCDTIEHWVIHEATPEVVRATVDPIVRDAVQVNRDELAERFIVAIREARRRLDERDEVPALDLGLDDDPDLGLDDPCIVGEPEGGLDEGGPSG